MTLVIVCVLMPVGHTDRRTNVEDEAYLEIHTSYINQGRSISFADCVEKILRESGATDDFQDFTKVLDPETNSNRLVDHLQGKVTNSINLLCENKTISLSLAIVLLIIIIVLLLCICRCFCC